MVAYTSVEARELHLAGTGVQGKAPQALPASPAGLLIAVYRGRPPRTRFQNAVFTMIPSCI